MAEPETFTEDDGFHDPLKVKPLNDAFSVRIFLITGWLKFGRDQAGPMKIVYRIVIKRASYDRDG